MLTWRGLGLGLGLGLGVGVDGAHVGSDDVRAQEDEDGRVEGLVPGQG